MAKAKNGTACGESAARGDVQLVLHPRWVRGGYRYDVEHDGALIVVGSRDPEHDAARKLVDLGIIGRAETIDGNTGKPRMRFDIERFAATRTVERNAGGLSTEPWRPMPSEISHDRSRTSVSDRGGREVAGEPKGPALLEDRRASP